jgi:hypothetical protein
MTSLAAFAPCTAAFRVAASKPARGTRRAAARATPPPRASSSSDDEKDSSSESSDSRSSIPWTDRVNSRRFVLGGAVSAAMTLVMTGAPSPAAAKDGKNGVYWISPKDGATVPSKFPVKMGVKGYELAPASEGLQEGTGHHHIVVDGGVVPKGDAIPFDATHVHFGKAQKEGELELSPGQHTLTLQFANAKHESFGKKFASTITVNVQP